MNLTKMLSFTFCFVLFYSCSHAEKNTVKILHVNDHHSKLSPSQLKLKQNDKLETVEVGGYPRLITKVKELANNDQNILKIHAGDATTGDLFYTLFEGKADADLMSEVCFDTFTFGNHEFDGGDAGLKKFLTFLEKGKCPPAILGANIETQIGQSPLSPNAKWESFKPYAIRNLHGTKVGIIGLTIAKKTKESSSPDAGTVFFDEAQTAQKYIDELRAQGINKIVLATHIGLDNDLVLINQLHGVGVIVGGDSHLLLGKNFEKIGLNPVNEYPVKTKNADGKLACIVQAWEYSLVLGELNVKWNDAGEVESCVGTSHLLTKEITPDKVGEEKLALYLAEVDKIKKTIVGKAENDFCLVRIPGEKRSQICSPEQTAKHGSDIATLVAYSFLNQNPKADFALQNAGGVRTDLAKGDISVGDIYKILPFANKLVNVRISGLEVQQALEAALEYTLEAGGSTGGYPYAAGLRFNVDLKKNKGQRFSKIEVKDKVTNKWLPLDLKKVYVVITSDYIASGKDGYSLFAKIQKEGRTEETYLDYAQTFLDYIKKKKTLKKFAAEDYSTQSFRSGL